MVDMRSTRRAIPSRDSRTGREVPARGGVAAASVGERRAACDVIGAQRGGHDKPDRPKPG
jgi:hypothetical protein